MSVLSGLKPADVFDYFEKLCAVPHGSGNTKAISDLCAGFARELGLKYRQDDANNLVIWKEASPGYEGAAPIILQGHMDMVCTKTEDCTKDMAVEGLDLMTDGEWVWAKDTTLGGDNGIACSSRGCGLRATRASTRLSMSITPAERERTSPEPPRRSRPWGRTSNTSSTIR